MKIMFWLFHGLNSCCQLISFDCTLSFSQNPPTRSLPSFSAPLLQSRAGKSCQCKINPFWCSLQLSLLLSPSLKYALAIQLCLEELWWFMQFKIFTVPYFYLSFLTPRSSNEVSVYAAEERSRLELEVMRQRREPQSSCTQTWGGAAGVGRDEFPRLLRWRSNWFLYPEPSGLE